MDVWQRRFDALDANTLRRRQSHKWASAGPDAIPLTVADMDLPVAEAILAAMRAWLDLGDFGYPPSGGVPGVATACASHLGRRYGWSVRDDQVMLLPGIIPAMYASVRAFTEPGDEVLLTTPLYPWFRQSVEESGRRAVSVNLRSDASGRAYLDATDLEERVTDRTRMIMLCQPHNPTGRVFTVDELRGVAELAERHDLWIVSDELHADLALSAPHTPVASLGPETAQRTITLYGPTKAFNIAGLKIGFAIAENEGLAERLRSECEGRLPEPNVLGQVAARAAFRDGDSWLTAARAYLATNRDLVTAAVSDRMPGVRFAPPEGTYLAWLDFRDTPLAAAPAAYLEEHAAVVLNEGTDYGSAGAGFARLNFATGRSVLESALDRIARAVEAA